MNPRTLAVLVVVAVASFIIVRARKQRAPRNQGMQVPALEADDEETLALDAVTERQPGQRRIRLSVKGGEVTLILRDPESSDEMMAFGKALLEPSPDRAKGAALVTAVAGWLHQPVPAPGAPGELGPFPISYVRLGRKDDWEANKLFFQRGNREAEVYLNLRSDGRKARLLEKDEDYREGLLAMLAMAARDGAPPRRSPQNDPRVASLEPLFQGFQPFAGAERVRDLVALPAGFLGMRETGRPDHRTSELLLWTHPREAPRQLAQIDGVVEAMAVAPAGAVCGLSIVYPKEARTISSADPGVQAILDLRTGAVRKLEATSSYRYRTRGVFSPDGRQLALSANEGTEVYDVASRVLLAKTPAEPRSHPLAWDRGGLLLSHFEYSKGAEGERTTYYRWRPGTGEPQLVPLPPLDSPDGRFHLAPTEEGVTITGPGGPRRLVSAQEEEREQLRGLTVGNVRWIGTGQLEVQLEEPMALDLATGKLHYLVPPSELRIEAVSADGRLLVVRDEKERFLWAQR